MWGERKFETVWFIKPDYHFKMQVPMAASSAYNNSIHIQKKCLLHASSKQLRWKWLFSKTVLIQCLIVRWEGKQRASYFLHEKWSWVHVCCSLSMHCKRISTSLCAMCICTVLSAMVVTYRMKEFSDLPWTTITSL